MTSPDPVAIDDVDSHARLRGDDVELVLCGVVHTERVSEVVLSRDGTAVSAPAVVTQADVRARTPRAGLSDGQWSIALGDGAVVSARLLVQGDRPVVLLPGARAARSVVPKPRRVAPTPSLARRVARRLLR